MSNRAAVFGFGDFPALSCRGIFLFPLARLKSGLDADKGDERKIIHPLLLSVFPKRVIDVFPVVEVLDIDIRVQAPLFESEPLFEPQVEPVVGRIAKGVDPGQGAGGS